MPNAPAMVVLSVNMPRIAWFSPVPPSTSGIARYNRELLPELVPLHQIDVFVDAAMGEWKVPEGVAAFSAYDFPWRNRKHPYDLTVYQLGNAPCHDYMWAYLFRYPGLVALHDGQLHHARGRMLLQQWRPRQDDYRAEFRFNHPDAARDIEELGVVGLLGSLTYFWPMLRGVVAASRRILVHSNWLADEVREIQPDAMVSVVDMGVPALKPKPGARQRIRRRHNVADDAVLFIAFGRVTPEKRIREAIRAFAAIQDGCPAARLLLAGECVDYYDMASEARSLGVDDRLTIAGYVDDEEVGDYLESSDVCLCMRWPTSRETSAAWLRCLAAGRPTISTDLAHTVDIPTLDPRNWSTLSGQLSGEATGPVGVSIDILDEDHSLKLAIRRLAGDAKLRTALGANALNLWQNRFQLRSMAGGYLQAFADTLNSPPGPSKDRADLPGHLRASGAEHAARLAREVAGISLQIDGVKW